MQLQARPTSLARLVSKTRSTKTAEKNVLFMHDSSATYDSTTMYPSTEYSTDTSDVRASRGHTDLVSLHKQDVSVNPELSIFE